MVALKPKWRTKGFIFSSMKQERRGGIETRSRKGVGLGKSWEAGTPWWH